MDDVILLPEHLEDILFKSKTTTYVEGELDPVQTSDEKTIKAVVTPPKASEIHQFTSGGNKIDVTYKVRTLDAIIPKAGDSVVIDGEEFFVKQVKGYRKISKLKTMYVGRTD
ncbi:MAG: hypothetical protein ACRDDX_10525 [Cellulosilyticaceae bacterium]